jgi:uncharacterized protein YnzC (UPF0291/DUF896 family)
MHKEILQAIAYPTELGNITLIALDCFTPNVMAENFKVNQQAVSKKVRILTEGELVKQDQKVREIYSSFKIHKHKEIDKLLEFEKDLRHLI